MYGSIGNVVKENGNYYMLLVVITSLLEPLLPQ